MPLHFFILFCLLLQGVRISHGEDLEISEKPNDETRTENHQEVVELGNKGAIAVDVLSSEKDSSYSSTNLRSHHSQSRPSHSSVTYHGPPPPPPPSSSSSGSSGSQSSSASGSIGLSSTGLSSKGQESIDKVFNTAIADPWPITAAGDMPKILSLDVKCEKNSMKVYLAFDKPFYGIVFSKGHYSNVNCIHLPAGLGRTSVNFEIGIHACGTAGNTDNNLYSYESGSGTYFENIVVIQYDPQVQEVWDQARKLRCTWHDLYEKSVTFRPFPVDMLDVVRADFAGDNVGCWMQIQVGKGPWASEVSGLVKIGQTMTMVLAIKDDDSKFDMLVRNCMAHDGKRAPIQLVDQRGCIKRPRLMSRFTKIKNFGASASVLSYAHFQAFKFPDSMEVHFQCTIQICRYHCPDQCSDPVDPLYHGDGQALLENHHASVGHADVGSYGIPPPSVPIALETYLQSIVAARPRDERRRKTRSLHNSSRAIRSNEESSSSSTSPSSSATNLKTVGVNRVIRVVSSGDLTFSIDEHSNDDNTTSLNNENYEGSSSTMVFRITDPSSISPKLPGYLVCMTNSGFILSTVLLLTTLIVSSAISAYLCLKLRPSNKKIPNFHLSNSDSNMTFNVDTVLRKHSEPACFYS